MANDLWLLLLHLLLIAVLLLLLLNLLLILLLLPLELRIASKPEVEFRRFCQNFSENIWLCRCSKIIISLFIFWCLNGFIILGWKQQTEAVIVLLHLYSIYPSCHPSLSLSLPLSTSLTVFLLLSLITPLYFLLYYHSFLHCSTIPLSLPLSPLLSLSLSSSLSLSFPLSITFTYSHCLSPLYLILFPLFQLFSFACINQLKVETFHRCWWSDGSCSWKQHHDRMSNKSFFSSF